MLNNLPWATVIRVPAPTPSRFAVCGDGTTFHWTLETENKTSIKYSQLNLFVLVPTWGFIPCSCSCTYLTGSAKAYTAKWSPFENYLKIYFFFSQKNLLVDNVRKQHEMIVKLNIFQVFKSETSSSRLKLILNVLLCKQTEIDRINSWNDEENKSKVATCHFWGQLFLLVVLVLGQDFWHFDWI